MSEDEKGPYQVFDHPVRSAVYNAMKEWPTDQGAITRTHRLAECLGFKDMNAMQTGMTDDHANICRMLAGPHGYIIYLALLARKQDAAL